MIARMRVPGETTAGQIMSVKRTLLDQEYVSRVSLDVDEQVLRVYSQGGEE